MNYNRPKYLALKAAHKCTRCEKQDDRTLAGFILCEKCRIINRAAIEKYRKRPDYIIKHRDAAHRYYRKKQREHKCTQCGKPLAEGEYYSCCASCRKKQSERTKEKRKKKKAAESGNSQTA